MFYSQALGCAEVQRLRGLYGLHCLCFHPAIFFFQVCDGTVAYAEVCLINMTNAMVSAWNIIKMCKRHAVDEEDLWTHKRTPITYFAPGKEKAEQKTL